MVEEQKDLRGRRAACKSNLKVKEKRKDWKLSGNQEGRKRFFSGGKI